MRIVQVQGLVGGGGAEVHTSILCRGLREQGHDVLLCIPDQDHWIEDQVRATGCDVARFPLVSTPRRLVDFAGGRWLEEQARRFKADVIHTHIWNADVLGFFARRRCGIPVVATLHGPTISVAIEQNLLHRIHHRIYASMLKRLDGIIAISDFVRHYVAKDLSIDSDLIDVVHNCSEVADYRAPINRAEVRSRVGIPEEAVVLVIVGELSPRKGILDFIRAAGRISKETPSAHFLVVGSGVLLEESKTLADELGISDRTHFVGQRNDVPDLLRASDVLAVTSYQEGFGRTITEAMSSGLPVVSFASGATPEIIIDEVTGFLTPEGNAEAFAARCIELMESEALRASQGAAGLARALEVFDVGPFVRKTEEILVKATRSGPRGPESG